MNKNMQIAETIRQQLGGGRFQAMTGARDFMAIEDGLQFRLPANFARDGVNVVRIKLMPTDTYQVRFLKVRATKVWECGTFENIYADSLQRTFKDRTGLDTRM